MSNQSGLITLELVDGTKVIVPDSLELITSYVLQEQGDWFEDEIKFLRKLVQPGDTVVDIGANYGVYALSLARKVGANGQLWAFEPASDTAQLLTASSAANGLTWLHVVQQALSDRQGTAWLQMPGQAELNSLVRQEGNDPGRGPGETVPVTTLDHCLEGLGWTAVDLLKMDAEGEEERILQGGARFFRELSPLVMFEVKAGEHLHLDLVQRFAEKGYQCFRLIPGLNALAPFSLEQGVDAYLLNLFAAKPDRAAALAASGWLVHELNSIAIQADEQPGGPWLPLLQQLPYARSLVRNWQGQELNPAQLSIQRALTAWSLAQDATQSMVRRYGALRESYALLQQQCQPGCPAVRWASLARVALALGERVQAVEALKTLVTAFQLDGELSFDEPFLCPEPTFESLELTGSIQTWLEAACLVALEKINSYSGFYTAETALPRLERVLHLGYEVDDIRRRLGLLTTRFGRSRQMADSSSSVRDWFHFLDLREPIRCLDVGVLRLGAEPEPWVRWAQEGCSQVLGFDPLQAACEQTNQQAKQAGIAMRYLPWVLGDGLQHTLHLTHAPMSSSLYPPARTTVELFSALAEAMHVEQQMRVQTHRLDDVKEALDADFLKLRAQGAALMILQNARQCLRSLSVIQCQVEFVELYQGQPLMADVDAFLRSQGFCLLRFASTVGRPFKSVEKTGSPQEAISQLLWADAIYVRDFRAINQWSERQLKAVAFILHEVYQAADFTALVLRELDQRGHHQWADCYLAALMASGIM